VLASLGQAMAAHKGEVLVSLPVDLTHLLGEVLCLQGTGGQPAETPVFAATQAEV
jgi:hypothetical protein